MTIQIPDPGTGVPADKTGDNPWLAMEKVAENFRNQTHAASRLVGTVGGNVMEVSAFGLGGYVISPNSPDTFKRGTLEAPYIPGDPQHSAVRAYITTAFSEDWVWQQRIAPSAAAIPEYRCFYNGNTWSAWHQYRTTANTTVDSNGFVKSASPVLSLYNDKIDLNDDAKLQPIAFGKLGVGDYLVKGSLGFAQEGWYIETPKDANGNVLVAVVYEQLANNDISIKTYAKRFDDETGDIVANLLKPRDIPIGRFISLRLHELPKEPPVMSTETQPEI